MGGELILCWGGGGVFLDIFFFYVGGSITAGLISGRGAYIGGRGGIIVCTFFPGRWAYNFGAYKWQFMVIYVVM